MIARALAPAAALLLAVSLAGCGGGTPGTDGAPSDEASPSSSPSATTAPPAEALPCTRDDLDITFTEADSSAGHRHGVLDFTNTAPSACTLEGYPILFMGNSEVEAPQGPQAGENATSTPAPITLEPGNVASSDVTITQAGIVDGCTVAQSTHFIAAPPQDAPFAWEDDGRDVPTPEFDSCLEDDIGLLTVTPLVLSAS